jgi:hypothetical protein
VSILSAHGKVAVLPGWPTVETLAWYLGQEVQVQCREWNRDKERGDRPHLVCEQVTIRETHVNAATWINPEAS